MDTPEKLYFSIALEIGDGGLLCIAALLQNVTESLTGEPHNVVAAAVRTCASVASEERHKDISEVISKYAWC